MNKREKSNKDLGGSQILFFLDFTVCLGTIIIADINAQQKEGKEKKKKEKHNRLRMKK